MKAGIRFSKKKCPFHDQLNTRKNLFYSQVSLPNDNGCMEWLGVLNSGGYGQINRYRQSPTSSHRFSYALFVSPITDGLHVLHRCDNLKCVAPDHLFLGTNADNICDCVAKGRFNRSNQPKGEKNKNSKLKEYQVLEIREKLAQGIYMKILAIEYAVHLRCIQQIKHKETWRHI